MAYVTLTDDLRAELAATVQASGHSLRSLAGETGSNPSALSRFLNGKQKSLREEDLKALLTAVNCDHTRFMPQLELPLDEQFISQVTERVRDKLQRMVAESGGSLRGTAFTGFVGVRVAGTVEKVFEGVFPLHPPGTEDAA